MTLLPCFLENETADANVNSSFNTYSVMAL